MIDIVIPVWNIERRGLWRVFYSCLSLSLCKGVNKVIIVDGSTKVNTYNLEKEFGFASVIPLKMSVFNKPKLLNTGIQHSSSEYVVCTDCDYLFKYDLFEVCRKYRDDKSILFKKVIMLPNCNMTRERVQKWKFPRGTLNTWGTLANGAMQYATRDWFLSNPHDERMYGWGAMDNMTAYKAVASGLTIKWVEESEILHIHHKVEKFRTKEDTDRFNENQKILANFITEHKLPKLLKHGN